MSQRCTTCHSEFLELELLEGRCITCWRDRVQRLQATTEAVRVYLREVENHCPCGARPESPNSHPHVLGCQVELALIALENQ